MRGGDGGFQFRTRDVHVRLERSRAQAGPVFDEAARVVRPVQFHHLRRETAVTFQVAGGDVHFRARHAARIDHLLEIEVGLNFQATTGARRGHTTRQIQARKTEAVPTIQRNAAARQIKQMFVHSDQARDHCMIGQIEALRSSRDSDVAGIAHSLNLAVRDHDGLILAFRRACSIDDADVRESDYRRAYAQERFHARLELLAGEERHRRNKGKKNSAHKWSYFTAGPDFAMMPLPSSIVRN